MSPRMILAVTAMAMVMVSLMGAGLSVGAQSGSPQLEAAKRAYHEGRFEDSMQQLEPLISRLQDPADLRDAAFYLGLSHLALRNAAEGDRWFDSAVRYDPSFVPSPDTFAPNIIESYAAVRDGLVGELVVESDPSPGRIAVDGREVGETPFRQSVLAGEHSIRVVSQGHQPVERNVTVQAGETETVSVTMTRRAGGAAPPEGTTPPAQTSEGGGGSKLPLILGVAGGGAAVAVLLAASGETDDDGDGFNAEVDCNDGVAAINPNGSVLAQNARFETTTSVCPVGSQDFRNPKFILVDLVNNSCTAVTISAASSMLTIRARSGTGNSVGDTFEDETAEFSPSSVGPGSVATVRIEHGLTCNNGTGGSNAFNEFEAQVTLTTSAGTFVATTTNRNRSVFPLQAGNLTVSGNGFRGTGNGQGSTTSAPSGETRRRMGLVTTELRISGGQAELELAGETATLTEGRTRIEAAATGEERMVRGRLLSGSGPGVWTFDFGGSETFAPSSIRVLEGRVLRVTGQAVVFQLEGRPGERVTFTFRDRRN